MDDLRQRLSEHGLTLRKVIFSNDRKKQVTALAADRSDKLYVVKWRARGFESDSESLEKEAVLYADRPYRTVMPTPVVTEPDFVVIEHTVSMTLRELLIAEDEADGAGRERLLVRVEEQLFDFFRNGYQFSAFYLNRATGDNLVRYIFKLCLSGPMGTTTRRVERFLNRLLIQVPILLLKLFAFKLSSREHTPCRIHGDLHLNNILVGNKGRELRIVDWETTCLESPLVDFLYCTVMIRALLRKKGAARSRFEELMEASFEAIPRKVEVSARFYYELFSAIIATNSRFQRIGNPWRWLTAWIAVYFRTALVLPLMRRSSQLLGGK